MKFVLNSLVCLSLLLAGPAFAAPAPAPGPIIRGAVADPAHVRAVQDLLAAMHIEKALKGVAGRSRYQSEAQRTAVYAKLESTPPADIYRRLAQQLTQTISLDTATEMTRFYNTPYGKQVIFKKYNNRPQYVMPGMVPPVSAEEQKERKRPAYVRASKALADADPMIQHEAFNLLQMIDKEKR